MDLTRRLLLQLLMLTRRGLADLMSVMRSLMSPTSEMEMDVTPLEEMHWGRNDWREYIFKTGSSSQL